MPLVDPLPEPCDDEIAAAIPFFEKVLGFTPNSLMTMQRRPAVAKAFVALNKAVMATDASRLTSEQKRLVSAVASYASGCRYCQAHTATAAKRHGASDARVENIWDWERSDLYTPAEKAAFAFAQAAASVPNGVDDAVGAALKEHWSDDEIVDILAVVSLFGFLNRWNDSMGTTLEDAPATLAEARLGAKGWDRGKHL